MTTDTSNIFPNFKPVTISDREIIEEITGVYQPYSDFNVLSMLSWNVGGDNSYSLLNGNLVIKLKDYLGDGYNYGILGSNKLNESISELFTLTDVVSFVPEIVKDKLSEDEFPIKEDRDSFDYIINTQSLSGLEGGIHKSLRKSISEFRRKYPDHTTRELDIERSDDAVLVMDLVRKWCEDKGFNEKETREDVEIVENFFKFSSNFNIYNLGLFVDGELIAFSLNELWDPEWVMGHFGKADNSYDHCSYMMEYLTALSLAGKGYEYINIQQDTGLLGLREAKMALKPEFFLKKYKITRPS
jgi:uncharacterized protein